MTIDQLTCNDFRCLKNVTVYPIAGINILYGENAQGKTSLLEAICVASGVGSHRAASDQELVAFGKEGFSIVLHGRNRTGQVHVEARYCRRTKRYRLNGVVLNRLSELLGHVPIVFFCPEDIRVVRGSGAERRRFLDTVLAQVSPSYLQALQRYRHALRQRNELLKSEGVTTRLLQPWDDQLAQYGTLVAEQRAHFLKTLSACATRIYQRIVPNAEFRLEYTPDIPLAETAHAVLKQSVTSDIRRKTTQRGAHRDDFAILLSGKSLRQYGSQGEQRTALLALRLAQFEFMQQTLNEFPLLLLDDVTGELDAARFEKLLTTIPPQAQCWVTGTDMHFFTKLRSVPIAYFRVREGTIEKETSA